MLSAEILTAVVSQFIKYSTLVYVTDCMQYRNMEQLHCLSDDMFFGGRTYNTYYIHPLAV